jgi:hypothetical protein
VRYQIDPLVGGVGYSYPDLAPTGKSSGFPIPRGTSSDGQIMVGAAFDGSFSHVTTPPTGLGTNTRAFRYTHTTGTLSGTTEVIPFLTDGTWNFPIALSSDGSVTVVAGNSTAYPGGEIYLTNGNNEVIDTLGSPNSGLVPRLLGGRTDDGVIAVTFANDAVGGLGTAALQGLGIPTGNRYSYFHNSRGWFHFSSALAAFGIDLVAQGWDPTNMAITSVRTVGGVDLVSGQGRRRTVNATLNGYVNGALEGFVAELPAGALAAFNPTPTPPADQSIVGTWYVGDPATTFIVLGFMADGTYVRITDSPAPTPRGFERGLYTWAGNAAGGALMITTLNDSDGVAGGAGRNGQLGTTAIISGDTFTFADTNTPNTTFILNTRIPMSPGSLAGGWVYGDAALPDQVAMGVFMPAPNLKYFFADDGPGGDYNLEAGTYTWDPVTHDLVSTPTVGSPDTTSATLSRDELGLSVVMTETDGDPVTIDFERIVAPSAVTPAFTGPLDPLGATTGVPFSFTVGTTLALTVTATGLPPGLAIDPNTGAITGTPTDVGTFNAQLTATNTFGATTNATLTIVVKSVQSPLIVVTPSNAIFGSTFTAATVGGSGLGAVSFAAAGACSNLAGGGDITMTSGTGTCVVTAAKAGDDAYYPTESTPVSVIAAQATSTTGLAAAPLSSSPGLPVTFTATVASQFGAAATGTVSFRRGGTTLGTAPVTSGVAQLTLTTLGVGTHVVSAIYAGDANVIGSTSSSVTISVVAPAAPTTTTLSSSLNPAIVGQTVTLTASVSSATAGTPTGSITFRQGTTVLATVPMSGAQATYSPNSLVQGSFGFTAVYSGDAQYIASTSATLVQQFNKASTTTTLTSTPNPSNGGQLVTFTATVSSAHPAGPTGSVTFRRGSTFLATVPVLGGSAVYATSALPSGSPQITAVYSGDIRYLTSTSAALTQQVNAGVTTTVLTISPSPSSNQQTVIFTATVTSSTGVIPTGLVTFKIGGTTIGMPVLLNASGVAVIGTSLPTGRYNGIRAQYEGDAYNGGSTSTTLSHIVQ